MTVDPVLVRPFEEVLGLVVDAQIPVADVNVIAWIEPAVTSLVAEISEEGAAQHYPPLVRVLGSDGLHDVDERREGRIRVRIVHGDVLGGKVKE